MQQNIPQEKLPAEHKLTEKYVTPEMERILAEAENIAETAVFANGAADDRIAVYTPTEQVSYGALRERINRMGNLLREHGVESGDRVIVQFGNTIEFLIANYAVQKLNAVVVPVSPLHREDDIAYIIEDADVHHAIVSEPAATHYADFDDLNLLRAPFDLDQYNTELAPVGEKDDFALLLYSSGTTGRPKGTIKTHEELLADATVGTTAWNLTPDDVIGGTAPITFAMGYFVFALGPFTGGAAVSLLPKPDTRMLIERVEQDGITILVAVPTSYNQMLDELDGADVDLSSLRICMAGGEALKRHTYDRWKDRFGKDIENYYGCTELLTIGLYQPSGEVVPCTNGVPAPYMDVTLLDGEQEGELAVKGPVRVRYWNNEAVQTESVHEGYFRTGDIFQVDDSGQYSFKCRKDDLIVTSGYKVSGAEVEDALTQHPHVQSAAVVGVPDEERGNLITAFVQANNGLEGEKGIGELQGFVKATIAPYKYPRKIVFVDELPRTKAGKIDRNRLIDDYLD